MSEDSDAFYRALSPIYDQLFPVEPATIGFLADHAGSGAPVLDLACGSGLYTEALMQGGHDVYGLDLSPDLIERARARSATPGRYKLADMRELGAVEGLPRAFGLIFCIGNSIAHLGSLSEVDNVLQTAATMLMTPGAGLAIQYIDTEEIAIGAARELPTLTVGNTRFERRYLRSSQSHVVFDAALVDTGTRERAAISNQLLSMDTERLTGTLDKLGLASQLWGGFAGQPTQGSWVRVILARRS